MIPSLLLSLGMAGGSRMVEPPLAPPSQPPAVKAEELPLDGQDHQPVLLGPSSREAILKHREVFRANTASANLSAECKARWRALDGSCVVVAAFGSWCGDSHRELPDLLALMQEPNPFVEVRLLGVNRSKKANPADWPKGVAAPAVERVPTFWVYVQQPGGTLRLAGSIVETPPVKGQRMAEALLDLLEKALRL